MVAIVSGTDGLGHVVHLQYDSNGNQVLKTDPLGNTVASTYNSLNQVLTETVAGNTGTASFATLSVTTRYVYDAGGKNLLRFVVSPEGRVTQYVYTGIRRERCSMPSPSRRRSTPSARCSAR